MSMGVRLLARPDPLQYSISRERIVSDNSLEITRIKLMN